MLHQPKFKIGQKVTTKKMGVPIIGVIKAINDPVFFMTRSLQDTNFRANCSQWYGIYEHWTEKPVYSIELSQAIRPMSLDEYKQQICMTASIMGAQTDEVDSALLLAGYNRMPFSNLADYPEEDLEEV